MCGVWKARGGGARLSLVGGARLSLVGGARLSLVGGARLSLVGGAHLSLVGGARLRRPTGPPQPSEGSVSPGRLAASAPSVVSAPATWREHTGRHRAQRDERDGDP